MGKGRFSLHSQQKEALETAKDVHIYQQNPTLTSKIYYQFLFENFYKQILNYILWHSLFKMARSKSTMVTKPALIYTCLLQGPLITELVG